MEKACSVLIAMPLVKANTIHNVTVSRVQTRTQCARRDMPQDRNTNNKVAPVPGMHDTPMLILAQ
jgi:hypothetical protein